MRKILIIFFGVIIILALLGIFSWNMLPSWISHKLSERAKVMVSIRDISLGSSMIKVDNIRVSNPIPSTLNTALEIKQLTVNTPFSHLLKDQVVINEMRIDDVYIGLEFESARSSKGNWSEIMKNLKESTKQVNQKANSKKHILIKKLIITDLKIDLAYRKGNKAVRRLRPIDRLELENISSEGGLSTTQIMDVVVSEMLRNIFSKEGLHNMLDNILPKENSGSSTFDALKGLFSDLILLDNNWDEILYEDVE